MFDNRVLRKIFGPKRNQVTEEWRKLHTEEFYYLYTSPNIIRVIRSKRMGEAGHVHKIGHSRVAYRGQKADTVRRNLRKTRGAGALVILKLI